MVDRTAAFAKWRSFAYLLSYRDGREPQAWRRPGPHAVIVENAD
jgi:hypothetical protein